MTLIQVLLIFGGAMCFFAYLVFFRSVFRDRLVVIVLFLIGTAAVLSPGSTTQVAQVLGVGRGADLIFYLAIIGGLFTGILLYGKIAKLERAQTELVRALALKHAEKGEVPFHHPSSDVQ